MPCKLAQQTPGGVHLRDHFLLLLDGRESRLHRDALKQTVKIGVDIMLPPPNPTHFMQPWDQIFGSIRGGYAQTALRPYSREWLSGILVCMVRVLLLVTRPDGHSYLVPWLHEVGRVRRLQQDV
jgi:hypothetical protein